jgi:hypothetical protein
MYSIAIGLSCIICVEPARDGCRSTALLPARVDVRVGHHPEHELERSDLRVSRGGIHGAGDEHRCLVWSAALTPTAPLTWLQPVNVLTVTAASATAGEGATSAAQTITVTDPPVLSTLAGAQDQHGTLQDLALDQRVALLGQYMASTFAASGAGDAAILGADPMAAAQQQTFLAQPQHL